MSGPWRPWIPFAIQSGCGTLSFLYSQLPASRRFVSGDPQSARGRAHDGESLPSRQSYPRGNILSSTPRPFSSRLGTSPIQFTLVAQMEPAARPRVWTGALECELPFIFCPARHRTKELPRRDQPALAGLPSIGRAPIDSFGNADLKAIDCATPERAFPRLAGRFSFPRSKPILPARG